MGHTLASALVQASRVIGFEPEMAVCDLGYCGHNYEAPCDIQVVDRYRRNNSKSLSRWWNWRSAIEPVIGYVKSGHRMDRNHLRGELGDEINVIFAAAGFNLRKLPRAFACFLCRFPAVALRLAGCPQAVRFPPRLWPSFSPAAVARRLQAAVAA